jgi:hypothetical protein
MDISINIDWSAIGNAVVSALFTGVQRLVSPLPDEFMAWLIGRLRDLFASDGMYNLLTHIPVEWTSQNSNVLGMWRNAWAIEAGLIAIVLTIQGYRVSSRKVDFWTTIYRTGFLVICGGMMPIWADRIFGIMNTASATVSTAPLDIRTESMPNDFSVALLLAFALFFGVLAWLKGVIGVIFLDVLLVIAPYFLTLSALPIFEGLGTWWAEEFTIWTLRPFMVALALNLGLSLGSTQSGGIQILFAIVSFWLAWSMDTRLRRFSVGAWGSVAQLNLFGRGAAMTVATIGAPFVAPAAAAAAATGTAASAAAATP